MDKNIYSKVCGATEGIARGHNIIVIQETLLDPKTEKTVIVTSKFCTQCGGTDDDLSEAPRGFGPKKAKKEDSHAEEGA